MDYENREDHRLEPLRAFLSDDDSSHRAKVPTLRPIIGVIEGTGIGPEIISAGIAVLEAIEQIYGMNVELRYGGPIGEEAEALSGRPFPESAVKFCKDIFAQEGAVLSGPGGCRYVYDQRRVLDLFCKFVLVKPWSQLRRVGPITKDRIQDVDILIVRDNIGGVYQGRWESRNTDQGVVAEHSFRYSELEVKRLTEVACRAAASRRGKLHVIIKQDGVPAISTLWRDISLQSADKYGVSATMMNIDLAGYELIQHPSEFDVIVTPNLFGDILVDVAGALMGSRGVTFSGNFGVNGNAVYQTNHGSAHDLAGKDIANPAGQILSIAMLLRESFGFIEAASLIEKALVRTWSHGWRTADLAEPGCNIIGTRAMAERVTQEVFHLAESKGLR